MEKIKLIALDMDGTLLDSEKRLSEKNKKALAEAARAGIEIVPTTGRLYHAIPDAVRTLPFLHYAITVNGAQVYDVIKKETLAKMELPWQQAVEIMEYLDPMPMIYDCYMDGIGYMTSAFFDRIEKMVPNPHYQKMYYAFRQRVPELKAFLTETKHDLQKIQICTDDYALRDALLSTLEGKFPGTRVTAAFEFNCEINHADGNKGSALCRLAEHLGIGMQNVMAIGDGLNDLTMLEAAGVAVAMENAFSEVKEAATYITASCDEDGVAKAVEKFCL